MIFLNSPPICNFREEIYLTVVMSISIITHQKLSTHQMCWTSRRCCEAVDRRGPLSWRTMTSSMVSNFLQTSLLKHNPYNKQRRDCSVDKKNIRNPSLIFCMGFLYPIDLITYTIVSSQQELVAATGCMLIKSDRLYHSNRVQPPLF